MGNVGGIFVNEFFVSWVKVLYVNISCCGISNVVLIYFDGWVFGVVLFEIFDVILFDVFCFGEGVVCKDVDVLKNWLLESNFDIVVIQCEFIDSVFYVLCSGGMLVYFICILNCEEN